MDIKALIATIDPTIYENLKQAVELGKWNNGTVLSKEQKALCMQAIIAYDIKHKPEHERVGYVAFPAGACETLATLQPTGDETELRPLNWSEE